MLLTPFLCGCLPGFGAGDDEGGPAPASFAGTGGQLSGPAINRLTKTSFLNWTKPTATGQAQFAAVSVPRQGASAVPNLSALGGAQPGESAMESAGTSFAEGPDLPAAQALRNFYDALSALAAGKRKHPVTIVHFGDNQIADDQLPGELRERFQSRFGRAGHGLMMPALFPVRGLKVDRAGQWMFANSAAGAPGLYGVTGVRVSASATDASIKLSAQVSPFEWVEVSFATGPAQGTANVVVDGSLKKVPTRLGNLDETTIRITARAREVAISPAGDGEIALTSIATGTESAGVRYVNLGLPGATAATPAKWNKALFAAGLKKLDPDLIVMSYGQQEGFQDGLDLKQYERQLWALLAEFKQFAPRASLLIMGPADAARLPSFAAASGSQACRALTPQETASYQKLIGRQDGRLARWHSPPKLEAVRHVLKRAAAAHGAYYWDWARFMGGPCSIHAWAGANPPLAAIDHQTLSPAGKVRSARALFAELMAGYDAFGRDQQALARQATAQAQASQAEHAAAKPRPKRKR